MRKVAEFIIYLGGVVFFSWNYAELKEALDALSFVGFAVFYLVGVARFATFVSNYKNGPEQ